MAWQYLQLFVCLHLETREMGHAEFLRVAIASGNGFAPQDDVHALAFRVCREHGFDAHHYWSHLYSLMPSGAGRSARLVRGGELPRNRVGLYKSRVPLHEEHNKTNVYNYGARHRQ